MTEPIDREDQAILDALAALEAEAPEAALGAAGPWVSRETAEADETLRRLHLETLGLLAYAAEPVAPSAGARERLLAALADEGGRPEEPAASGGGVVPLAAPRPPSGGPAARAPEETGGVPARRRRGRAGGLLALAAVLVVAALGVAGWFYLELDRARAELARLDQEHARLAERLGRQETLIHRGGQAGEVIAAVATRGVEVCTLHPVGDPPMLPGAYAVLYMPPGSGKWYLLGSNLEPAQGVYAVWLHTAEGAVPAGVLPAGEESVLELDAAVLGDLSDLTSITVTMEPSPDVAEPEGPMVLYGDERMTVL